MDDIHAVLGLESPPDPDLWTDDTRLRSLMNDLLRYFVRRLPSRDVAADCSSDVMLVIWQRRKTLPRDPDELRAYAFGVARKTLLRRQREFAKVLRRLGEQPEQAHAPSHSDVTDMRIDVQRMLAQLKSADRELLLLTAWERLSLAEAAAVLGISHATARQRHSRALRRLADSARHIDDT